MRDRTQEGGFSLLEVLVAVAIVGIVYGFLLQFVTSNLSDVGDARRAADISRLAEERLREIEIEAADGKGLTDGSDEGTFEEPNEDVRWQVTIEPWQIPLPEDYTGPDSPSAIFQAREGQEVEAVVRKVDLRVFVDGDDPEQAPPFVIFVIDSVAAVAAGQG